MLRAEQVAAVRHFNRTVTRRIGALAESYLGGRPLAEDRLLYEIGHAGAEVRAVRARLGLDSGYTSRLLKSLTAQGLVACGPAPGDGRVRWAALTPAGRRAHAALERQSDDLAQQLAAGLDADRATRLVDAMRQVDRLLTAAATRIVPADAATPDAQWCLEQYFAEIAVRFEQGLDRTAVLTADPHEVTPPHGAFFLAVAEGRPVGCGALKRTAPGVADVKRVWVSPDVRGGGVASPPHGRPGRHRRKDGPVPGPPGDQPRPHRGHGAVPRPRLPGGRALQHRGPRPPLVRQGPPLTLTPREGPRS